MNYARWSGLAMEFGGAVIVLCAIGYWLDEKFNAGPWFLLIGFFLAFATVLYNVWKQTQNTQKK
jgi:F0F1-type ATP synthase assembly protein I